MTISTTLFIAIIGILGTLINSYLIIKSNKNKNTADIGKLKAETLDIQIDSMVKINDEMRDQLAHHKAEIENLKSEINTLKGQENIHLKEKIRMESKIQELVEENTKLRKEIADNKLSYTEQILQLNEQIRLLQEIVKLKK